MEIEIINGFVWAVLDGTTAIQEWANENNELYTLYTDGTEALIQDEEALYQAIENYRIGIEIGTHETLKSDWQESCERNRDNRSFYEWLEDKADCLFE